MHIDIAPYIDEAYVSLQLHGTPMGQVRGNTNDDQTVMATQHLLSIMRLSQGLVRLHFSNYVAHEDADEAIC